MSETLQLALGTAALPATAPEILIFLARGMTRRAEFLDDAGRVRADGTRIRVHRSAEPAVLTRTFETADVKALQAAGLVDAVFELTALGRSALP